MERAILGHYERLNQAIAEGSNETAFADIQEQIREKEQRVSEIVDEMAPSKVGFACIVSLGEIRGKARPNFQ